MEIKSYLHSMLPMMSEEGKTVLEGILIIGNSTPDLPSYMKAIGKRHRKTSFQIGI